MSYKFSERLKKALAINKMTAADLHRESGLSQALISQYLNDKFEPKNDKISIIAEVLNVSELYLAGFSDDITHPSDSNIYGDHDANLKHFENKPELLNLYKEIYESESLQLLFDSAKDLTPEDLETVLIHIQGIRKARGLD